MPDSAILNAAARIVSQTGPENFTLADVGQEVGLSAATLVQRFGSKRLLMLAMLEQMTNLVNGRFVAKLTEGATPLDSLYAAALDRVDPDYGPEHVANGMAFVFMQISDPDFKAIADASAKQAVDAYKTMLDNAVEVGELSAAGLDTHDLAETIHSMTLGSLMMWVVNRDIGSRPRTKRDLDTLLRPYRRSQSKVSSNHSHKTKTTGPKSTTSAPANADNRR